MKYCNLLSMKYCNVLLQYCVTCIMVAADCRVVGTGLSQALILQCCNVLILNMGSILNTVMFCCNQYGNT